MKSFYFYFYFFYYKEFITFVFIKITIINKKQIQKNGIYLNNELCPKKNKKGTNEKTFQISNQKIICKLLKFGFNSKNSINDVNMDIAIPENKEIITFNNIETESNKRRKENRNTQIYIDKVMHKINEYFILSINLLISLIFSIILFFFFFGLFCDSKSLENCTCFCKIFCRVSTIFFFNFKK
jgi:hypothetical protein